MTDARTPKSAELVPAAPDDLVPETTVRDAAKALYMAHMSAADISRKLSITNRQLSRWRTDEAWALEREIEDRALIEDGFSGRKVTVSYLATLSLEQLKRGMDHLAKRHEPPSIQEMERLSTIAGNLDKLNRLDTGRSTENLSIDANVRMTAEEIRKTILADPFLVHDQDPSSGS